MKENENQNDFALRFCRALLGGATQWRYYDETTCAPPIKRERERAFGWNVGNCQAFQSWAVMQSIELTRDCTFLALVGRRTCVTK